LFIKGIIVPFGGKQSAAQTTPSGFACHPSAEGNLGYGLLFLKNKEIARTGSTIPLPRRGGRHSLTGWLFQTELSLLQKQPIGGVGGFVDIGVA
jgi:hypothetical protein